MAAPSSLDLTHWLRGIDQETGVVPGPILDALRANLFHYGNPDRCWLWNGTGRAGYPVVRLRIPGQTKPGYPIQVHRMVYELLVGRIPTTIDGEPAQLDHLCRVPRCCNPAHLEPVSRSVNLARRKYGEPGVPQ